MKNYYNEYITERIQNGLPFPPHDKDEYKEFVIEEIMSGRGLPPIKTNKER